MRASPLLSAQSKQPWIGQEFVCALGNGVQWLGSIHQGRSYALCFEPCITQLADLGPQRQERQCSNLRSRLRFFQVALPFPPPWTGGPITGHDNRGLYQSIAFRAVPKG